MMLKFDCSVVGGDPTGRFMDDSIPQPAQQAVIASVVEEKLKEISMGKEMTIDVWQDKFSNKTYILDGQHRFVACCIAKCNIALNVKKVGFPAFRGGWVFTRYENIVAAKNTLAQSIALAKLKAGRNL